MEGGGGKRQDKETKARNKVGRREKEGKRRKGCEKG